jgi:2-deoxy-D-gluconate 3-dehydrogenase
MSVDLFKLEGKTALVTGASAGLGAAIAVALAKSGASVAVHGNSRSPEDTRRRIESAGGRAVPVIGDLSQRETGDRLVGEAIEKLGGRLDILINNAGTIRRAPAAEHSDADWDYVLDVNLSSVFRLCRAAGRHMIANGRGKIVNIASLLTFQGGITVPGYAASKGAVGQLTKALANEWASKGVNVNAIAPGYMKTDNTAALQADPVRSQQILVRIPAGRWGEPEDLAGAAVFLSSSASDYVNGHVLVVDGGWMGR